MLVALLLALSLLAGLQAHLESRVIEYRQVDQDGAIGVLQTAVIEDLLPNDEVSFASRNMFRSRHIITVTVTKEPVTEYYTQTTVDAPTSNTKYIASTEQLYADFPDDSSAWYEEATSTELVCQTDYTISTETVPETTPTKTSFEQATTTVVVTAQPTSVTTLTSSVNLSTQTATNIFPYSTTSFYISKDDLLFRPNSAVENAPPIFPLFLSLLLAFAL